MKLVHDCMYYGVPSLSTKSMASTKAFYIRAAAMTFPLSCDVTSKTFYDIIGISMVLHNS